MASTALAKLRAWCTLIRLPNIFTVPGDVAVGFMLTGQRPNWAFAASVTAGVLLYCAGLILNDAHDLAEDQAERPLRPLPSGAIAVSTAISALCLCMTAAFVLGLTVLNVYSFAIICGVSLLIVLYNTILKMGWVVGLCRVGLIGLGASTADFASLELAQIKTVGIVALTVFAYVVSVSWVAARETQKRRVVPFNYLPALCLAIGCGALRLLGLSSMLFNYSAMIIAFSAVTIGLNLGGVPEPRTVQRAVGYWLVLLPLVQASFILLALPICWPVLAGLCICWAASLALSFIFPPS